MATYELHKGDCLEIMATMPESSIDTIITDPPYGLSFMGKDWDHGVPGVPFWTEALRVAKPGAMLLAFGGTRTFHRLTCAIEDAGWEIRDCVMWVYGSGFPKSHNISKGIDRAAGAEREVVPNPLAEKQTKAIGTNAYGDYQATKTIQPIPATEAAATWDGYGTALKPAWEPIIVAMKPTDGTFANNALTHGVAGLWVDGGRVGTEDGGERNHGGKVYDNVAEGYQRPNKSSYTHKTDWKMQPAGRWPANVIHDGSDDVLAGFPVTSSGDPNGSKRNVGGPFLAHANGVDLTGYGDTGSAARFFYCAKASRSERNAGLDGMPEKAGASTSNGGRPGKTMTVGGASLKGEPVAPMPTANHHPTVKPLALMRYLCRLTKTPTGGTVLDPFMGSGSTGCAAVAEGREFIGIDVDPDYVEIARRRIEHALQDMQKEQLSLFEANGPL